MPNYKPMSIWRPGDARYTTPSPHATSPPLPPSACAHANRYDISILIWIKIIFRNILQMFLYALNCKLCYEFWWSFYTTVTVIPINSTPFIQIYNLGFAHIILPLLKEARLRNWYNSSSCSLIKFVSILCRCRCNWDNLLFLFETFLFANTLEIAWRAK